MGLLTLPQGCLAFIDANVVIYSVEKIEPYSTLLLPMWEAAKAGDIALIGSELLLLETLVKPLREKDTQLESIYRNLLLASNEHGWFLSMLLSSTPLLVFAPPQA